LRRLEGPCLETWQSKGALGTPFAFHRTRATLDENVMAKVIEFYILDSLPRKMNNTASNNHGKLMEFTFAERVVSQIRLDSAAGMSAGHIHQVNADLFRILCLFPPRYRVRMPAVGSLPHKMKTHRSSSECTSPLT
jgi:hypothetical protein